MGQNLRCYDAETIKCQSAPFKKGFCMISFLKSFGEVIVSSKFERKQRLRIVFDLIMLHSFLVSEE